MPYCDICECGFTEDEWEAFAGCPTCSLENEWDDFDEEDY